MRCGTCGDCKHWKVDDQCKDYQPGNRFGQCTEIQSKVAISLDGDARIDSIDIDDDFGCVLFQPRDERGGEG
jgi:hypothetical protein